MTELQQKHRALIEAAVEDYRKCFERGLNDGRFAAPCQEAIVLCDEVLGLIKA